MKRCVPRSTCDNELLYFFIRSNVCPIGSLTISIRSSGQLRDEKLPAVVFPLLAPLSFSANLYATFLPHWTPIPFMLQFFGVKPDPPVNFPTAFAIRKIISKQPLWVSIIHISYICAETETKLSIHCLLQQNWHYAECSRCFLCL